ncbi:MAG: hypothetical protein WC568_00020 [Candidatus Methanoperedens sp.]
MGRKRKGIKKNKEKINENKESILPLVFLLLLSIFTFIIYYVPSIDGLIFIYNLFYGGKIIVPSALFVFMLLGFQFIILKKTDSKTKDFIKYYSGISSIYFFSAPSFLYDWIISNKLHWIIFLIAEYFYELIAVFIIISAIKKQNKFSFRKLKSLNIFQSD